MNYTNNRQSPPAFISPQMYYTGSREFHPRQPDINVDAPIITNFFNLMMGRCTLNDIIMDEFKNNGIDSPYEPQEELGVHKAAEIKPRPVESGLSQEQLHVLCSLPSYCVYQILKGLEANGVYSRRRVQAIMECRFCKNNNEQEAYYRSHILKDSTGRVVCPVLRDFVCRCCGASGDNAHTIKYCPQSSDEDRMVSCAMLRTSRMSSGRRRGNPRTHSLPPAAAPSRAAISAPAPPLAPAPATASAYRTPLDPDWAALEKKLMLY